MVVMVTMMVVVIMVMVVVLQLYLVLKFAIATKVNAAVKLAWSLLDMFIFSFRSNASSVYQTSGCVQKPQVNCFGFSFLGSFLSG
jgi:hypothetical protein